MTKFIAFKSLLTVLLMLPRSAVAEEFTIKAYWALQEDFQLGTDHANHVLWQVYANEMGWRPAADEKSNPTHIRVERGKITGYPVFVNDYDDVSIRLVAYLGSVAVGTLRIAG